MDKTINETCFTGYDVSSGIFFPTIILFKLTYICTSIIDYENLSFPCFGPLSLSLSLSSFQIQIATTYRDDQSATYQTGRMDSKI